MRFPKRDDNKNSFPSQYIFLDNSPIFGQFQTTVKLAAIFPKNKQ